MLIENAVGEAPALRSLLAEIKHRHFQVPQTPRTQQLFVVKEAYSRGEARCIRGITDEGSYLIELMERADGF
jgi:hypothetical protein